MSIEKLKELLPYSGNPTRLFDWEKIESLIGMRLPEDYKEFVEFFGGGQIDEFLMILSPFETDEYKNLITRISLNKENRKILEEQFDQLIPYPEFPAEESLLQFGITDNGDELFWKVSKNVDDWIVVVNESRSPEYEEFDLPFGEFLSKLLSREIKSAAFPTNFPLEKHTFIPF
jgi:hypothetical protein